MPTSRTAVVTSGAPEPPPFLSQAIVLGDLVFCSGQVGSDPKTGAVISGSVADRTKQALANLKSVLEAAGSSLEEVGKVNIFLTNTEDFSAMNSAYVEFFSTPRPARTCVFVKALPLGTDVEIECVGRIPKPLSSSL
ncbi:Endoribonuclease L-PSP [Thozetella sp. PMI_491]|nr:Endoribonuclease L-PSP [Thozetella sp. PMI_491]